MAEQDIYLGNPNLKKANTRTEFSAKQIQEFIKCKKIQYTLPKIISR